MKTAILATALILLGGSFIRGEQAEQTTCPVMEGTPVDRSIFTEYQGKKVYFCCKLCRQTFIESPEKYLPKLPPVFEKRAPTVRRKTRLAQGALNEDTQGSSAPFSAQKLIKPLGIATYGLLVLTVFAGLFRKDLGQRFLLLHKTMAILTIVLATAHALLILSLS